MKDRARVVGYWVGSPGNHRRVWEAWIPVGGYQFRKVQTKTRAEARRICWEYNAKLEATPRSTLQALNEIHALLDGKEWTCDTMEEIARVIRSLGYEIREPLDETK